MIETVCLACGQKSLSPEPPEMLKDAYQRMDFEAAWDREVERKRHEYVPQEG